MSDIDKWAAKAKAKEDRKKDSPSAGRSYASPEPVKPNKPAYRSPSPSNRASPARNSPARKTSPLRKSSPAMEEYMKRAEKDPKIAARFENASRSPASAQSPLKSPDSTKKKGAGSIDDFARRAQEKKTQQRDDRSGSPNNSPRSVRTKSPRDASKAVDEAILSRFNRADERPSPSPSKAEADSDEIKRLAKSAAIDEYAKRADEKRRREAAKNASPQRAPAEPAVSPAPPSPVQNTTQPEPDAAEAYKMQAETLEKECELERTKAEALENAKAKAEAEIAHLKAALENSSGSNSKLASVEEEVARLRSDNSKAKQEAKELAVEYNNLEQLTHAQKEALHNKDVEISRLQAQLGMQSAPVVPALNIDSTQTDEMVSENMKAAIMDKKAELYDLEQEILMSPRSKRKQMKQEAEVLDTEIAELVAERQRLTPR